MGSDRRLTLAAFLLAFLLAACGGAASSASGDAGGSQDPAASQDAPASVDAGASPEDEAPGTTLTACEVVTADDVTAATGVEAEPGEGRAKPNTLSPNYTECVYQGDYGRIVVQLDPNIGDRVFKAAKKVSDDAKDLPGIGDGAFWTAQNDSLYAVKGKVDVLLRMFVENGETVGTELAKRAIARL